MKSGATENAPPARSARPHLGFLVLGLLVATAPPVRPAPFPLPAGQEGPLANDTFLPLNERAAAAFTRGDEIYTAQAGAGDERQLERAFDSWRQALVLSVTGDAVPPPSAGEDTSPRHSLGVEEALLLRLAGLPPAERALFSERFTVLAQSAFRFALAATGSTQVARLADLEREYPATVAAVRAALALADRALETGRPSAARTFLERAARHRRLAGEDEAAPGSGPGDLAAAIERRRACLTELLPPPASEDWARVDRLEHAGSRVLRTNRTRRMLPLPLRGNVQPGRALLADGTLITQDRERAYVIPPHRPAFAFQPWKYVSRREEPLPPETGSAATGRWPLYPLALNGPADIARGEQPRFLLVAGRSAAVGDNALVALDLSPNAPIARDLWTFSGSVGPARGEGQRSTEKALGTGRWEWEPGPVLSDTTVLVQARQAASEGASDSLNLWLIALAKDTGEVLWKRFLAKGAPLRDARRAGNPGPVRAWTTPTPPGQPLAKVGGAVFCGTNLGVAALVDAADGRLRWTIKNRRAPTMAGGWKIAAPPPITERGIEAQPVIVWTPADSDHLYELLGPMNSGGTHAPTLGGGPLARARVLPFASSPRPRGEAIELLGASGDRLFFLGRSGARLTLTLWEANGRRADSLYLGRNETFTGAGLTSPRRAMFATSRGLYLFDTSVDPSLLELAPLGVLSDADPARAATGGTVFARGTRVWVLAPGRLDEFRVRGPGDEGK
jgi:hypothetical protein